MEHLIHAMKTGGSYLKKVTLLDKKYHSFESWSDIERDVSESFDNKNLPGEGQGFIHVTMTYVPNPNDPKE